LRARYRRSHREAGQGDRIDTNSYKYSGIAIFDCAPAIGEAIVKLVKATA
jgi:hypothetical protein